MNGEIWTCEHTEGEETEYGTRQETRWIRDVRHAGTNSRHSGGVELELRQHWAGWIEQPGEFTIDTRRKWPVVKLVVGLPEGRYDLRSELAQRLADVVDQFVKDFDLGK
jgi:hypothetical protein